MGIVNKKGSKWIFGFFNSVILIIYALMWFFADDKKCRLFGMISGSIFMIISGPLYGQSEKDAEGDTLENGPTLYKTFLILNSVMFILSILGFVKNYFENKKLRPSSSK
jgi:hypothetical protein